MLEILERRTSIEWIQRTLAVITVMLAVVISGCSDKGTSAKQDSDSSTATQGDLGPGEKRDVKLAATSKDFDGWTAHPEVGIGEHGSVEGRGEHDREGRGEHK
jgi:hypothetical protein